MPGQEDRVLSRSLSQDTVADQQQFRIQVITLVTSYRMRARANLVAIGRAQVFQPNAHGLRRATFHILAIGVSRLIGLPGPDFQSLRSFRLERHRRREMATRQRVSTNSKTRRTVNSNPR